MPNRFASTVVGLACLIAAPAFADDTQPVVEFVATGGTIAMKIDPIKHAPVPAISGEDLLATVPDVSKYARVEVNNLSNIPSRPVRVALQNQRDTLLAFAGQLDAKLAVIVCALAVPEPLVRQALMLHRVPTTSPAYWQG